MKLRPEVPLVGFHGMATEDGLDSLGLILLDTTDERCQQIDPSQREAKNFLDNIKEQINPYEFVENSITPEEKERADLMEAILLYSTIADAR